MAGMQEELSRKLREEENTCPDCGKQLDSFACRIRHQYIDMSWARGDH